MLFDECKLSGSYFFLFLAIVGMVIALPYRFLPFGILREIEHLILNTRTYALFIGRCPPC